MPVTQRYDLACDDAVYADGLRAAVDEWEEINDLDDVAEGGVIRRG